MATELTDADVESFRRDGYLVLRGVMDEAEILPIEARLEPFRRGQVAGMGRDLCDMSAPYGRPFAEFACVNAMLPRVYDPELRGNAYETRCAELARRLVGPQAALDYDQLLAKRPRSPAAAFAWHQDLGYWPAGAPDDRTATFSLALDDAGPENGCLRVVPGSNREPALRPHRPLAGGTDRQTSHALVAELRPSDRIVHLDVRRGDVTVHDERVVHGSAGNAGDHWRRTYVLAFRPRATVAWERELGFTHSHEDRVDWTTHLEALARD